MADHDDSPRTTSARGSRSFIEFARLLASDGDFSRSERIAVLTRLIPDQNRALITRFFLMLTLSVTIAVMGLVADSVAVVIGAMLIAPLMTPIMSFAAAVGLGLARRTVQAAVLVATGTAWSILYSILLARILPNVTLGSEILGRTSPDVRDLIVAIAAGAAGAYAIAHEDVSATLPGVAVAVALVPPLATTGILIESGELVLAEGSALLFLTNLFAIAFSALATLLLTGVIPTVRFFFRDRRMAFTVVGIVIATIGIAIPLTGRSLDAAASSRQQSEILAEIDIWLGGIDLDVTGLDVIGDRVTVELTGLAEPPEAFDLATRLVPILGADAEVTVRWDARAQGTASAGTPPPADPQRVATDVLRAWVDELALTGTLLDLLDVTITGDRVEAVVSGPLAPPSSPTLADRVADALGEPVTLAVRWIQSFDPTLTDEPPARRVERLVDAWIGPRTSVRLIASDVTGSADTGWTVLVDLAAQGTPLGLDRLHEVLRSALVGDTTVTVRTLPLDVVAPEPDRLPTPALD
ncbi:MAG: hypothetical protein RIR49_2052 [Actinomycetota bacterium]